MSYLERTRKNRSSVYVRAEERLENQELDYVEEERTRRWFTTSRSRGRIYPLHMKNGEVRGENSVIERKRVWECHTAALKKKAPAKRIGRGEHKERGKSLGDRSPSVARVL